MARMTTIAVVVVVAVMMGLGGAPARAGEGALRSSYPGAAAVKLAHGLGYMLYSPAELVVTPVAFAVEQDRKAGGIGAGRGLFVGLLFAPFNVLARYTIGGGEAFTFAFVGDPTAARPFDFTPQITGWSMTGSYQPQMGPPEPVRTAVASEPARRRPSGD
jgi:hypothetical protein